MTTETLLTDDIVDDAEPLIEDKDYFSELVGEGKRYKDPQALARSKAEADWHISRIERENAELRKTQKTQINVEEFLDQIRKVSTPTNTSSNQPQDDGESNTSGNAITAEDLEQLLSKRELEAQRRNNIRGVKEVLIEQLGPNYSTKVKAIAEDIGWTDKQLETIAGDNPKAFYKLLGLTDRLPERFDAPVRSTVRTEGFRPSVSKRNYNYYKDLMKKEPNGYLPPNLYAQMEKDAVDQGDSFYS